MLDSWRESAILLKALFHVKELSYDMAANMLSTFIFQLMI